MKAFRSLVILSLILGFQSLAYAQPPMGPRTQEESDPNNPNWPSGDGFLGGKAPDAPNKVLKPGHVMDRYGHEGGRFTAPLNTPLEARAMRPGAEKAEYHRYEVLKPLPVKSGKAAPWFGQPGGGKQYALPDKVANLKSGPDPYIREVKVKPKSHPQAQAARAKAKPKQAQMGRSKPKARR